MDGFRLKNDFVVPELGWCDKSGKRMGFIHYSHDYVWSSLTQQERRTVKYLRDMVTGLTFKPRPVEFQRGRIGLQKKRDIFSVWEQFKTVFVVTSANGFSDNDNLAQAYKNCMGTFENPYTAGKE